jgi:hypothetical protein
MALFDWIPASAGMTEKKGWIPASAGMTNKGLPIKLALAFAYARHWRRKLLSFCRDGIG